MAKSQNTRSAANKPVIKPSFVNTKKYTFEDLEKTKDVVNTANEDIEKTVGKESNEFGFPDKIILKPFIVKGFRLGLEVTKENYLKLPGTSYNWEPSRVGDTYKTGLQYITEEQKRKLEAEIGKKLDYDFYCELGFRLDASNPHGQHIDLSKPYNKVIYLAMLDSHLVARTESEKRNGTKPEADFYIENLEAEAELKASKRDRFLKITEAYRNISDDKKMAVAKILDLSVRGLTKKVADSILWEHITEAKGEIADKIHIKFLEVMQWPEEKINVHSEVFDAIATNVIRRSTAGDYLYGDDVLGATKEQVVSKVLQDSTLRAIIKSKLILSK